MWMGDRTRRVARRGAGLIAATLVCAALLAACAPVAPASGSMGSASTLTPALVTATPAYTATPAPPAGTGWRNAGPATLQSLYFAPSDPLTSYTCLNNRGDTQRGPLTFGVSHDGGYTWRLFLTAIPAIQCQMAINPGDAATIAIAAEAERCEGDGCEGLPWGIYISRDAGASWSPAAAPVAGLRDWGFNVWLAWVGDTLFVGTNGDSATENQGQARPVIAASVNGAPLASVGADALGQEVTGARLASFLPLSASLFVELTTGPNYPPSSPPSYLRTDAAAASFIQVPFMYQGNAIYALAAGADGKTLIGQTEVYTAPPTPAVPLLVSRDGGLNWRALPAFPQAQDCCYEQFVAGAADGSIVAEVAVYQFEQRLFAPSGVFELRPGAEAWVYVSSPPPNTVLLTVSSDASGRPNAVWAPGFGAGLPYHPLT